MIAARSVHRGEYAAGRRLRRMVHVLQDQFPACLTVKKIRDYSENPSRFPYSAASAGDRPVENRVEVAT